ncbi:DUF72 domain-containing protein [Kribbella shirazensis]|uniref:Uncharacterized protein YecE (DUF72 family) n=1 Tax=Kribbella shirazensis TaxID=1105143 RepID=A0A7X5ZZ08_9ACTN|nr:DUF72 domain-containing protein [Kribbella shirazensis]NIK55175.1 uncharacterized protein YecE (DUF72 family) [Kribbella shirazensis]
MTRWQDTPYRVGISGWRYPPWRKVYYPEGLPQRAELEYASARLNSIELNGSFYSLQRPTSYQRWYDETPDGFVFAVKGPRFVTHLKRLADVDAPLANFFASGVLALGNKLGPVLWQLPPNFRYDAERCAHFFDQLPRTTVEAAEVAKHHDERMEGRALLEAPVDQPLKYALEVRHDSFKTKEFLDLARDHDIAVVCADTAGKWPMFDEVTADFAYVRLHGADELYVSGYDDKSLARWARKIRSWKCDTYVYFDNDAKVHAPYDAENLSRRLGIGPRT